MATSAIWRSLASGRQALFACLFVVCVGCGESIPLRIVEPSAGETLIAGTVQTIRWEKDAGVSKVDIWLNVPNGPVVSVAKGADNSGTFTWDVPLIPVSSAAMSALHVASSGSMPARAKRIHASNIVPAGDDAGTLVGLGSLAGFRWNEATEQEEYYWIDTTDGSRTVKGVVGDLAVWQGQVIVDYGQHILYVLGVGGTLEDAMNGRGAAVEFASICRTGIGTAV